MRIALAQTSIIWEDKKANQAVAEEYIIQAAKAGAQAVFFPEMSLTGFSMNIEMIAEKDETTVCEFSGLAIRHKITIGIGWVKQNEKLAENHYTIISSDGEKLSDYIKIHPFSYANEDKFFVSGKGITSFRLGDYNWSNFICYDLRFPEVFQIASRTAEVILVPANWPRKREEHWKHLLTARAIENQCYLLAVNCVGFINDIEYGGISCCVSPNGDMIDVLVGKPGILIIDLKENIKKLRARFPIKQDRKWELYISEYRRVR